VSDVIASVFAHSAPAQPADSPLEVLVASSEIQSAICHAPTAIDPRTLDFLSDHRFLNGTQTMLIDLNRCTRCDDCVRACAATHDNNPRFVREGPTHDGIMVANACLHCVDPVCMIGCPTGAIARDTESGAVRINDLTCVGCSTCESSCPYQAIRMVEIREPGGAFYRDEVTGQPILKATKCDFCAEQLTGPACQNACPHDALVRMDMSDGQALSSWLHR
jgi:Fe-S-cluster-containing dehydrogenase component